MKLTILTPHYSSNSLGRAFSLWLTAQASGFDVRAVAVPSTTREPMWAPLQDQSDFRDACVPHAELSDGQVGEVLVAVKVMHSSLGKAVALARETGARLVADVDDLDWEGRWGLGPRAQALSFIQQSMRTGRPPVRSFALRHRALRRAALTTSNPALQRLYGGRVVPHVRADTGSTLEAGIPGTVAFIGTPRPHKGIDNLRAGAAQAGYELTVTASPPADPRPNERWVGETSLAEGLEILSRTAVLAAPSSEHVYARYQFPVKIVDAMMMGKAVLASDLPPTRWALGDAGLLLETNAVADIAQGLHLLREDTIRRSLGHLARARALAEFTPSAAAAPLQAAVEAAK